MSVDDTSPEVGRPRIPVLDGNAVLALLALIKLLVHLITAGNYGYFRDELYYIAASERLAFGYVDFPPLVALVTAFVRATLGDAPLALRLLPALAGAVVVVLAGLMARELGAAGSPRVWPRSRCSSRRTSSSWGRSCRWTPSTSSSRCRRPRFCS